MLKPQPLSFFNKNLIIKNKILISFILFAGLFDILTTLIGINYFGLSEVNSLFYYGFPLGVFIWVPYFVFIIYLCERKIFKINNLPVTEDIKKQKNRKETLLFLNYYKYMLVIVSLLIPFYNSMLILGVGLI